MKKHTLRIAILLLLATICSTENYAQEPAKPSGKVYVLVKQEAEYPGGTSALLADFSENFKYPEEARKKEIEGRLVLNFVVEKDGSISHVKCTRSLGHGLDEAAILAVKSLKNFSKPAMEKGEYVRSFYTLPVRCSLDDENSKEADAEVVADLNYTVDEETNAESGEKIHDIVSEEAVYPGGTSKLLADFSENFKYPDLARRKGIQGRLIVNFVVEKDGSISNAKCIRSLGHGLDEAAIRAVKSLKNFSQPAKLDGQPVRSYYSLPVNCGLK